MCAPKLKQCKAKPAIEQSKKQTTKTPSTKSKLSLCDLSTTVASSARSKILTAELKKRKSSKYAFVFLLRGLALQIPLRGPSQAGCLLGSGTRPPPPQPPPCPPGPLSCEG